MERNYIRNCPIIIGNAKRALHIHGPDVAKLKSNMTRKKLLGIDEYKHVQIPKPIMNFHATVNLSTDYFYIQSAPFLHIISRSYNFRTIEVIMDGKYPRQRNIREGLKQVISVYDTHGLEVIEINAGNNFTCLREKI